MSSGSNSSVVDHEWISATSTYNYMMKDPLLDWLKRNYDALSRKHRTYRPIIRQCLDQRKSEYNFTSYIMNQGVEFERKVMKLLVKKFGTRRIAEINGELGPRDPNKVKATWTAMQKGIPFIHSGVVHNHQTKTFGIPDLLVRSDWLKHLVSEDPLSKHLSTKKAPKLKGKYHYRVVDIKFTTLLLRADGIHLLNSGSFPAYKSQLYIYNQAIGRMQGYTPLQTYILGRRWKYSTVGIEYHADNCFDRLGVINYRTLDRPYIERTKLALEWIREVRSDEAASWDIKNYPLDRWELYPNMCNHHDFPWRGVKEKIAMETHELTKLWMVGPKNRAIALDDGIYQWTDAECCPINLGIKGEKTSKILSAILEVNHQTELKVMPRLIQHNYRNWKTSAPVEFFVDFETTNGAMSKIKHLPNAITGDLIFMIGVGYVHPTTQKWIYKHFTVHRLTYQEEERICREFSLYIVDLDRKFRIGGANCYHWAPAENILWDKAVDRHYPASNRWKSDQWNWMDLMQVFKREPVVIQGCMSFGLKDVATSMKQHGFIQTGWNKDSNCVDGRSAMIAAQKIHLQSKARQQSMHDHSVMDQIIEYNEVDVKVLYEILTYLRDYHVEEESEPSTRKRSREQPAHRYNLRKRQRQ